MVYLWVDQAPAYQVPVGRLKEGIDNTENLVEKNTFQSIYSV